MPKTATACCPKARRHDIVCEEVLDDYVVYDLVRHHAHALNSTASRVWTWCDGETDRAHLANRLAEHLESGEGEAELVLDLALDRLNGAGLLEPGSTSSSGAPITRRSVLRRLTMGGVAVLLPVVYTLSAPQPVAAASCNKAGKVCPNPNGKPCCGICNDDGVCVG